MAKSDSTKYWKLILSYDQFNKIKKKNADVMYYFTSGKQYLYYFGAQHCTNPGHKHFSYLKAFWQEFLEKCHNGKRIVLVEGGDRSVEKDEITAIKTGGEGNFIAFLADQEKIPVYTPEPEINLILDILLKKGFKKEEIVYFYFATAVQRWLRLTSKPSFEVFISHWLKSLAQSFEWGDVDFSYEHMGQLHKEFFKETFNLKHMNAVSKATNPEFSDNRFNELARWIGFVRDCNIVSKINKIWQEGYNIFIVYGAAHALMQKRAIEAITSGKELQ